MDFIWESITEWLKEVLVGGIMDHLSGMFDAVNQQVGDVATQVGTSPANFLDGDGHWPVDWPVPPVVPAQCHHVGAEYHYLHYRVWPDDRNLFGREPCADSICHIRKSGAKSGGTELPALTSGAWFSGISDSDLCRNLCGTDSGNLFQR